MCFQGLCLSIVHKKAERPFESSRGNEGSGLAERRVAAMKGQERSDDDDDDGDGDEKHG